MQHLGLVTIQQARDVRNLEDIAHRSAGARDKEMIALELPPREQRGLIGWKRQVQER